MIGGLLCVAIAAIGAAYARLVICAGPRRRDNLMFGALAATDALMILWRGVNVLTGGSLIEPAVTLPCAIGTVAMSVLTINFLASFPRRRAMPWPLRVALVAWGLAAFVMIMFVDFHKPWESASVELFFFLPTTLLVFVVGAIAWRRTVDRDARTVIAMLGFRWAFGFFAYFIAPRLHIFEAAVWAETTFATLVSFVVIGTAVLRSELFSIKSSAGEALVVATIGFVVVVGGGAAVWGVLAYTGPSDVQEALLVGATLVPLALAGLGWMLFPRFEKALLDERGARRLGIQDEPLPGDAATAITEATRRISAIGNGAKVRWQAASELPAGVIDLVRDGSPRTKHESPQLPACLVVPAFGADGAPLGAFLVDDGLIDRDTFLVARDLGARVALVLEREQAIRELGDARRLAALGQFAAAIAHDIRTPLTSISLNVQILRRKLQLSEDDAEHLDIALEELARLDHSVAEILDFAKPVRLAQEAIDVGELLDDATRGLTAVLSGRGVSLRCEPPAAMTVHGDPQRLRQVLVNLVDNAADASTPGAEVTVRASVADARVSIEIEDTGRGIQAADLDRIFEPFFTTRPDGTGLGLAIVNKVVRAHGGEMRVKSVLGQGSTFTVLLPCTS